MNPFACVRASLLAALVKSADAAAPAAVSCTQDSYALCAYSKCTVNDDTKTASCPCYELSGPSLARIDVIPDAEVMQATKDACTDATACADGNAPICEAIADGTLWPGADAVSTFSRAREVENGVVLDGSGGRDAPSWTCDAPEEGGRLVPNCMLAPCRSLVEPATDSYFAGEATMECTCPLIRADVGYGIFGGLEDPCDGESLVNTGGPVLANHAKDSAAVASAWEAVREAFNSEAKDDGGEDSGSSLISGAPLVVASVVTAVFLVLG